MSVRKLDAKEIELASAPLVAEQTLEGAADLILGSLPGQVGQIFKETAQMLAITPSQLILGLLQKAYDTGEHTAPVLHPEWMFSTPTARIVYEEKVCACGCATLFIPRWPGQQYACTECGIRAARAISARETSRVVLASYQLGDEPDGVARSTIRTDESKNTADDSQLVRGGVGAPAGGLAEGSRVDAERAER